MTSHFESKKDHWKWNGPAHYLYKQSYKPHIFLLYFGPNFHLYQKLHTTAHLGGM